MDAGGSGCWGGEARRLARRCLGVDLASVRRRGIARGCDLQETRQCRHAKVPHHGLTRGKHDAEAHMEMETPPEILGEARGF